MLQRLLQDARKPCKHSSTIRVEAEERDSDHSDQTISTQALIRLFERIEIDSPVFSALKHPRPPQRQTHQPAESTQ